MKTAAGDGGYRIINENPNHHLESHDDLISVRDRLTWAKTPRILLVWPKYENVSLRFLDLKVLQRHADSLGAQLGLVTRRLSVRRDAEALHIPVFKSARDAQRDVWPNRTARNRHISRVPRRDLRALRESVYIKEPAWRTSLVGRVTTFTLGVLAVLALAGLFVPRAAVTLYPEAQVQSITIPVSASDNISSVSLTGSVPARVLTVILKEEGSLVISSMISVSRSKAKGIAQFRNLSQGEVSIPAGTIVLTSGDRSIRFVTMRAAHVLAGVGQVIDVPIAALSAGAQGNVDADSITVVEGPLGLTVAVTNPEPTEGGIDARVTGPTEADRNRLRKTVMENLLKEAETQMRQDLSDGDILLLDTFDVSRVLEEAYSPEAGQPGKELNLSMEVEFTARYISAEDLNQLTLASLDASLPKSFSASALPIFKPVAEPTTDSEGVTHFELEVTRPLLHQVGFSEVFALTQGKKPESARDHLTTQLSQREPVEIKLTPAWWPWMPLIPFNVSVEAK
jgi:hypothetical protein